MIIESAREFLLRARETLSRAEISRRTGITPAKLYSIEKGREPTVEELAALLTLALKPAPSTPSQTPDQRPVTEPSDGTADLPGEELELVQWADTMPPPDQVGLPEWIGLQRQKWGEVRQEEVLGEWTDLGPITDVRDETGSLLAVGGRLYVAPVDATPALPKTLPELSLEFSLKQLSPTQLTVLDGKRRYANSELWTFKRCRRKWWLTYYRGRRLRHEEPTGPKFIGDRIHRALAAHYVPPEAVATDPRDALERLIVEDHTALVNFHHPEPVPVEVEKRFTRDSDLERVMLDGYVKWVEETGVDNEYVVIAPEQAVEVDLPEFEDVKIIAKLDVRVRRLIDNAVLWLEHKTKSEFSTAVKLLPMDEQVLFQTLVETLHAGEGDRVVGALYNLLRRVKRTGTAKPPFYQRVEVHHNKHKIDAMLRRTIGTVRDVEYVRWALNNGEDHQRVAFPTPTSDCAWDCPFVTICPLFDDGSRAEAALDSHFEVGDAYEYYTR